jgi:hypothetical protein
MQNSDRPTDQLALRLKIVQEINDNPDQYKGFAGAVVKGKEMWTAGSEVESLQLKQLRQYISDMKQPGVWGGHLEIAAFVECYPGYSVVVIEDKRVSSVHSSMRQGAAAGSTRPIYALYQVLYYW